MVPTERGGPEPGSSFGSGTAHGVPGGRRPGHPSKLLKLPAGIWLKIVPAFALAAAAISLVPGEPKQAFSPGTVPPLRTMVLVALFVSVLTAGALYWSITRDLRLAPRIAGFAAAYNVLVIAVKFVLAPRGLYEVNRSRDLETFFPVSSDFGAIVAAGTVFLLYLMTYVVIYKMARSRLGALAPRRASKGRMIAIVAFLVLLLAVPGAVIFLFFLLGAVDYLDFVFSSAASLLIALVLAGAASLAALALGSVADRAQVVGDAAVLVSFFWLGLWFLALYHVLWVVYILVITSIWPLKVVVPK